MYHHTLLLLDFDDSFEAHTPSTPSTLMNASTPSTLYNTSTDVDSDSELDISMHSSIELTLSEDGSQSE